MTTLPICLAILFPADAPRSMTIVAFGDSTTALRRTVKQVYATRLPALLGRRGVKAKVINAGVGGSHTGSIKDNARHRVRHARDRLDQAVRRHKPEIVLIQFGINDSWVDSGKRDDASRIPLDAYRKNLEFLIGKLRGDKARVILMTPNKIGGRFPRWRIDRLEKYVKVVRDLAAKRKCELIDVWKAYEQFETRTGKTRSTLMLDGTHPNDAGHKLLAELIATQIVKDRQARRKDTP